MPSDMLWVVGVVTVETLAALVPLRHPRPLGFVTFMLGYLVNELPVPAMAVLGGATLTAVAHAPSRAPGRVVVVAVSALVAAGLIVAIGRGLAAGPVIAGALHRDLGLGRSSTSGDTRHRRWPRRSSLARILLAPVPLWRPDVRRLANIAYGEAGRHHRLDLFVPRRRPRANGHPVFIHFHGGHFRTGGKSREARPLLHRLASHGWVCVSANYRLGRAGRFPHALHDAKRVIEWVRDQDPEASTVVVAGSSAGAHLASMAALTANDPAFQPGFEDIDTHVNAVVCLYGYYGTREQAAPLSSPRAHVHPDAPPFFVAHGSHDTLLPPSTAQQFVDLLRATSTAPVVYARLPGAQHSFDLFHSPRFEHVVDGVEDFTTWVRDLREPHDRTTRTRSHR